MAGGDELLGGSGAAAGIAAMLFIGAGTNVYDAFSAVMSSPWSTEKFTNDAEEEKMAREYVRHALTISWVYAVGGAAIASRAGDGLWLWPLIGAAIVSVYMFWLYNRALNRGTSGNGMTASADTAQQAPAGAYYPLIA